MANEAPALVLLIGLAVGVDYSMFYLKRERQERAAGRSERAALEVAAATSGRSVLISGLTVMLRWRACSSTGDATFASLGARHDPRRRRRGLGLADGPARRPLEARRQGRPAARPVRRPAPPRRRRGPDLGRDRRPRLASARALGGRSPAGLLLALAAPALQPAARAPGRTRSRSPRGRARRTTGCRRRSPARRCPRTSSSRHRT